MRRRSTLVAGICALVFSACTTVGPPTTVSEYRVALRKALSSGTYYNPYFPLIRDAGPEIYPDVEVVWRIVTQTGELRLWTTLQTVRLGSQRRLSDEEIELFVAASRRTMQEAVDRVPLMQAVPGGRPTVLEQPIQYRYRP